MLALVVSLAWLRLAQLEIANQDAARSEEFKGLASLLTSRSAPFGRSRPSSRKSREKKVGMRRGGTEVEVLPVVKKPDLSQLRRALDRLAADCANEEAFSSSVSLLLRYIENIIKEPGNAKFRHLRKSSRAFAERISIYPSAIDCLEAIGFQELPDQSALEASDLEMSQLTEAAAIMRDATILGQVAAIDSKVVATEACESEPVQKIRNLAPAERFDPEAIWALKHDWTDEEFQDGAEANKERLQTFEDELVARIRASGARELGVEALPETSHDAKQSTIDASGSSSALARTLEPSAPLWKVPGSVDLRQKVLNDPEVLGSALDIVVAYLKNYEVDKAGCIIEAILPVCREKGGLWLLKALERLKTVRMKQGRLEEALKTLEEVEAVAHSQLSPEDFEESWEFWEIVYRDFAWILGSLDRPEEAIAYVDRAIDVKKRVGKEASWFDFWDIGRNKALLALHSLDKSKILDAQAVVAKAFWLHRDEEPNDLTMRAKIWHSIGECSFALGHLSDSSQEPNGPASGSEALEHYRKALNCFKESHALFSKTEGPYNPLTGTESEAIAWTLMKLGDDAGAKFFLYDALEAASLQQSGWGDGEQEASALLHAMQGVERILEVHRRLDDRDGLAHYFDGLERLCGNVHSRLALTKGHPEAEAYERLLSSCATVMVASGTSEGTSRAQNLLRDYLWDDPLTQQAVMIRNLLSPAPDSSSGLLSG